MYKLTLYFEDRNATIFQINNLDDMYNILITYPEYTKMTLERIKTLKR